MFSPPVDRSLDSLHPFFRIPFEAWLRHAESIVQHVEFRVTETGRTRERQAWLYAQGRPGQYQNHPQVTWTMDSRHRWGLAADIAMIRKSTGQAIWEVSSYQWLYRVTDVDQFGIMHIGPREWVHLEHRFSDAAIQNANALKLTQT